MELHVVVKDYSVFHPIPEDIYICKIAKNILPKKS